MKTARIKYYVPFFLGWTILIIALMSSEIIAIKKETTFIANREARTIFNKDQAIRFMVSSYGGVYVPIDSLTQPNPALSHFPERDIETPSGKKLTLMNPAYFVRQLNEYFADYYGVVGHLTSEKLLRLENAPDNWERDALQQFEDGIIEVSEFTDINGEPFLRLMQPLILKQSCLKCHEQQGYKLGDIRGGISVSLAMKPLLESATKQKRLHFTIYFTIWLIGIVVLFIGSWKLESLFKKQDQSKKALKEQNSELKEAKSLLALNEKIFNEAQKIGKLGHWELNIAENKLIWSDEIYRIFDLKPQEFEATYESFLNNIHPDDREMVNEEYTNSVKNKTSYVIEHRLLLKSDKLKYVLEKCYNEYDNQGKHLRSIGTVLDITAQKEVELELNRQNCEYEALNEEYKIINEELVLAKEKAEESEKHFRKLIEKSPLPMVITDEKNDIKYLNDKFTQLFGYTLRDVSTAEKWWEVAYPDVKYRQKVRDSWLLAIDKALQNNTEIEMQEWELTIKDRTKRTCEFHMVPLSNKSLIVMNDITENRKNQVDLIEAKERAEKSDQLKTEFLNNMSHEIRTPLNGIIGYSDMLDKSDLDNDTRHQYIKIIQSSGDQLLQIIDDVLEISTLETTQIEPKIKEVSLNDLLVAIFSVFDTKAKKDKISFHLKKGLSDEMSIFLTDRARLNKIISNLLENAFKYTNDGYIEIGYVKKGNFIEIYVKDTGSGICPDKFDKIFETFSQEESGLTRKTGGLGLGLSIAKANVELIDGKISLESNKGHGTTFYITIPYKPAISVTVADGIDVNQVKPPINKDKYTILIVEDEEINYLIIETLLKEVIEIKCDIIHAKNGQEAVDSCKTNYDIDFVLMDLKMPIMDGYEATKQIKEIHPELPIVAQTAYTTLEDKNKAKLAGCSDFISKPINREILNEIINKYLVLK
jgi:PAS domain S-box-containing protein